MDRNKDNRTGNENIDNFSFLNFPYKGKIIDQLRQDKNDEILGRARFTSPDGNLSYYIAVIENKKWRSRVFNDTGGFYIERKFDNKTTYDFIPFRSSSNEDESIKHALLVILARKSGGHWGDVYELLKKYAQQKIKNYHISGDENIEYKNDSQKKVAEVTPIEIFKEGGIVRSICNFLNQKIEI